MEQLIINLEAKINSLTKQLENANKEIKKLKGKSHSSIEYSASMDLLQNMADLSTEDPVQHYIEDALDLLDSKPATKARPVEQQLNFDLFHEHAVTSSTTTTTEQTAYMTTTQQPELSTLQEDENLIDTNISSSETSENTKTETTALTPEQKKRQKNQKNNRRLIKLLEDRYPKAFDWNQPKPLKVGIDKDMSLDDEFNASKQKRALAAYTRSDRYKKCLLSGQPRIDLNGVAVNNEPALPESMIPAKPATKTRTTGRPDREKATRPTKSKPKPQTAKPKQKPQNTLSKQDDIYDTLSPEERMKAKLAKLLNKS